MKKVITILLVCCVAGISLCTKENENVCRPDVPSLIFPAQDTSIKKNNEFRFIYPQPPYDSSKLIRTWLIQADA